MSNRTKFWLLVSVGLLAVAGCIGVVYGLLTDDWRAGEWLTSLNPLNGHPDPDATRYDSRAWSFDFHPGLTLAVDASNAELRIARGITSKISVEAWLEGSAIEPEKFTVSASLDRSMTLRVIARPSELLQQGPNDHVRIILTLPDSLFITLNLQRCSASINDIKGTIDLQASQSTISLADAVGLFRLHASASSIVVQRCKGEALIDAPGGSVEMEFTDGSFTVEGAARIDARSHFGGLTAFARGTIKADLLNPDAPCQLRSTSGDVEVGLLPGVRVVLDIHSGGGSITSLVALDSIPRPAMTANRLHATINGGGTLIAIDAEEGRAVVKEYEGE